MAQIYFEYLPSPVGDFLVAGTPKVLHFTGFSSGHQKRTPQHLWRRDAVPLMYAITPLQAYFAGEKVDFDIPYKVDGTEFQRRVWSALCEIPYGETVSYGDIARRLECPGASRAIGAANAANHLPIIIPCHRVIGADGSLTGFGGGLKTKKKLLRLEGIATEPDQFDLF
ncbi:MAG TPA: methylated-DNA--[protein]-cysteine S-methyltransferase [Hellea balneolensis]|uniref:Methylated-DNA--protein-cysteine methyltransferase n=1 Tax=Hellea balneolensis TaxID=287478 RepID=A0A7C5LTZ0_9PROT|nr:methylated-DNA--[protein]-cysteine S-methyltransferase [Hellea balneolensis]